MKTITNFLSRGFRLVRIIVLGPFDYLFFGGVGVLWRSREEWQEIFHDCLVAGRPLPKIPFVNESGYVQTNGDSDFDSHVAGSYRMGMARTSDGSDGRTYVGWDDL